MGKEKKTNMAKTVIEDFVEFEFDARQIVRERQSSEYNETTVELRRFVRHFRKYEEKEAAVIKNKRKEAAIFIGILLCAAVFVGHVVGFLGSLASIASYLEFGLNDFFYMVSMLLSG